MNRLNVFISFLGLGAIMVSRAAGVNKETKPTATVIQPGAKTRGERNNNPGNLRFDSRWVWHGQKGKDKSGYLIFDSASNGIRAMAKDLLTKYSRGLDTVEKIINVYAPTSENPTAMYAARVATEMGVAVTAKINLRDRATLTNMVTAMIRFENGRMMYDGATIQSAIFGALA